MNINKSATDYLNSLERSEFLNEDYSKNKETLLFPKNADLWITNENSVITKGLSEKLDKKKSDLLNIIKIDNPLKLEYSVSNIITPRTYAESLSDIPQHLCVQAIVFTRVMPENIDKLLSIVNSKNYQKTPYDNMWIGENNIDEEMQEGKYLMIMNRRVGGWDGSIERPVIELLGCGGHLQTIWDEKSNKFRQMSIKESLVNEYNEEFGQHLDQNNINVMGGFYNNISHELVVLCALIIPFDKVLDIYNHTKNNYNENIDGIYLGTFDEVMRLYNIDASAFAGGEKAKPSNFPSNVELMRKINEFLILQ